MPLGLASKFEQNNLEENICNNDHSFTAKGAFKG
jgi:hypothetical protein